MAESTEFEVPVDAKNKATEYKPFKMLGPIPYLNCGRSRKTNPHMRGFWAATLACTLALIGWFAFPPLLTVVREDIGLCDNQALVESQGAECVCQQACKSTVQYANIASVSLDVLTRFILGAVVERLGPVNTDCVLLLWGALIVAWSTSITNGTGLIVVRFLVSALGSTFVVSQSWNSNLFNATVVGTANATAGGWGNLGGGLTQLLMPVIYRFWHDAAGLEMTMAWRASMYMPVAVYLALAAWIFTRTQDTTTEKFDVTQLEKTTKAGGRTYLKDLTDYRVVLMCFQYSACFGCELVMNNTLATHFHDYFGVDLVAAGAFAATFGGMNLFARSLGGSFSDWAGARWAMTGRLWAHFISLFGQALFLFLFGSMNQDMGKWAALAAVVVLAVFVNMAKGTSYGIVPYMIPEDLAVVSALVGAGGTLGAVIATWAFYVPAGAGGTPLGAAIATWASYVPVEDDLLPYKLHAAYVLFWAFTVFLMRWPHLGSMFAGPAQDKAASPNSVDLPDKSRLSNSKLKGVVPI